MFVDYKGERCEVLQIAGRTAKIKTSKGEWMILLKDFDLQEEKPEPKPEPAPDFEEMTKAQLCEYADEHGIEVNPKDRKAEIIEAIKNA